MSDFPADAPYRPAYVRDGQTGKYYRVGGGGGDVGTGPAGGDLTGTYPNPQIAAGAIVNNDINNIAAIAQSKILNLEVDLASKAVDGHTHVSDPAMIPRSVVTTKGDLIVGTGSGSIARLPVGTLGQVLTADPTGNGVKWAASVGGPSNEVLALPVGDDVPDGTPTGTLIVRYQ